MRTTLKLSSASAVLSWGLATGAIAQETGQATPPYQPSEATPSQAPEGLQEIVVTATRRDTNLQTTPVAVSAVNEQLIDQAVPQDVGDLAKFVPNFSAARITGFNAASFAMRGVGQNTIIVYFEPPVAVLVDDFVVPSVQSQLLDTFDVAQVEVLRGPQGTLFGKNTTGGAVVVRTKRPELDRMSVQAEALYGKFDTREVKAALNIPLVPDVLALRLIGGHSYSDGYMRNGEPYGPVVNLSGVPTKFDGLSGRPDGRRIGGEKVWNGRAKLLWEPSAAFNTLLQYEILRDNSPTPATVNITPQGDPTYLFNALGFGASGGNPYENAAVTDRKDNLHDQSRGGQVHVDGVYSNTNFDVGFGTFTNVIGYRSQRSKLTNTYAGEVAFAPDGDVLSLFDSVRADNRKTFQEELRLATDFEWPFNFVAGGFYQRDRIRFCSAAYLGFLDLAAGPSPFGPWNDVNQFQCNGQKTRSTAAYIEGNYKLTERLTLTGGFRYSWEKKTWQGRQQIPAQLIGVDPATIGNLTLADFDRYPQGVITITDKTDKPTYRASISYEFNDDLFGYFTYSHGFKSGGFNDNIGSLNQFGTDLDAFRQASAATKPEYADSYEAGIKSELFDRRLRANLTGFYVKYNDLQRQVAVPIVANGLPGQITAFFNAASSRVYGLEGELTALPIPDLTLRAVFGYQKGKYLSYDAPIAAGYDLTEAPLDRTPKWQATFSAAYQRDLGASHKLVLAGDVSYTGRNLYTQSLASLSQNTYLNARTLVNASITLAEQDDRYFVRLIGQNLTDKTYRTAAQDVGGLWQFALYGRPRFFGIQAGFNFGM